MQVDTTLTGTLTTKDGMRFEVSGTLNGDAGSIDVPVPVGVGECSTISFLIQRVNRDSRGSATAFSGQVQGICCGTILEPFAFTR